MALRPNAITAAVIDNGFAAPGGHPLCSIRRLDFANGAPDPDLLNGEFPQDEGTHGMRAAALIDELAGGGTEMLLCRVAARGTATDFDRDAANAVHWAARQHAAVVYFGWASYEPMPRLSRAIRDTKDTTLYVAPAGNATGDIDRNPVFPAAFDHDNLLTITHERLLTVGARDDDVGHGMLSVDTLLVGLDHYNRQRNSVFSLGDTSGAAAAAAGLALGLALQHRDWSPAQLKAQLLSQVERPQEPSIAAQLRTSTASGGVLRLPG